MLPQFLILDGPPPQCRALAASLISTLDCTYQDFTEPTVEALIALHYDGNWRHLNLEDPVDWQKFVPFTNLTVDQWIAAHRGWMRSQFGPDIMGRLFTESYRLNNREDLYDCTIIRDFDSYDDLVPLFQLHDPSRSMMVHLGPLRPVPSSGITYHLWCPKDDIKDQLALVLRDIQSFIPRRSNIVA